MVILINSYNQYIFPESLKLLFNLSVRCNCTRIHSHKALSVVLSASLNQHRTYKNITNEYIHILYIFHAVAPSSILVVDHHEMNRIMSRCACMTDTSLDPLRLMVALITHNKIIRNLSPKRFSHSILVKCAPDLGHRCTCRYHSLEQNQRWPHMFSFDFPHQSRVWRCV